MIHTPLTATTPASQSSATSPTGPCGFVSPSASLASLSPPYLSARKSPKRVASIVAASPLMLVIVQKSSESSFCICTIATAGSFFRATPVYGFSRVMVSRSQRL